MNDIELEEQRMLADARMILNPDPGAKRRVLSATLMALDAAPAAPQPTTAGEVLWHAPGLGLRIGAAALLSLASGLFGYALSLGHQERPQEPPVAEQTTAPPQPVQAPAASEELEVVVERGGPAAAVVPMPVEARPQVPRVNQRTARRRRESAKNVATTKKHGGGSLQRELAALREVEAAQRAGHAERALALLASLDQQIPEGELIEERRAAYVIARCTMGTNSPQVLVDEFVATFPRSVYTPRLRRRCLDLSR
ncbi:MAG: hypothetical protein OXU20_02875 [Myxococcales bacterium]|nr:hypothetical protein [Myxococcales bacterium]MDD9965159.1 hypothetical protein [Myxococcales bacterium]